MAEKRSRSLVTSRSCISMPRSSTKGSMMTFWSEPSEIGLPASCRARLGPMPSARSRSVVGQMQAPVPVPPSSSMSRSVEVGRVDARQVAAERSGLVEQLGRGVAVEHLAGEVLAVLLGEVHVQRQRPGRRDDLGQVLATTARTEWIAAPRRTRSVSARSGRHPLGPGVDGAVAEPSLAGVQLDVAAAVEAALEVAGVEQREPDAGLVGGLAHGETHRVGVAVAAGRPAGGARSGTRRPR